MNRTVPQPLTPTFVGNALTMTTSLPAGPQAGTGGRVIPPPGSWRFGKPARATFGFAWQYGVLRAPRGRWFLPHPQGAFFHHRGFSASDTA